jgi:hypothetical protein
VFLLCENAEIVTDSRKAIANKQRLKRLMKFLQRTC